MFLYRLYKIIKSPDKLALNLVLATILGGLIRLWNLPSQIIGGDELHAIKVAISLPLTKILMTFSQADFCLPLSAFYRILFINGITLGEIVLRLPSLVAGICMIFILPWLLVRDRGVSGFDVSLAIWAGWLIALSPSLVLFSRVARPYTCAALFTALACLHLYGWIIRPNYKYAISAGFFSGLALWFHPLAVPAVLSAYLFVIAASYAGSKRLVWQGIISLVVPFVLITLLLLGPALPSLLALSTQKVAATDISLSGIRGAINLLIGATSTTLALPLLLFTLWGFIGLFRQNRLLASFTAVIVGTQLAGLLILRPLGISNGLIFGRYLLLVWPMALPWIAAGFASIGFNKIKATLLNKFYITRGIVIVYLVLSGPLLTRLYISSSFTQHRDFQYFSNFVTDVPGGLPSFYRELPSDAILLEVPMSPIWALYRAVPRYQMIHGREILVASPTVTVADLQGVTFRNWLPSVPETWLKSRATILVLHHNPLEEELRFGPMPAWVEAQLLVNANIMEQFAARLTRDWGQPYYSDGVISSWNLDKIRSLRVN